LPEHVAQRKTDEIQISSNSKVILADHKRQMLEFLRNIALSESFRMLVAGVHEVGREEIVMNLPEKQYLEPRGLTNL
jgi:hypothetical protein